MAETVSSIGEFGLIDRLDQLIDKQGKTGSTVALGIGDDCAVFGTLPGNQVVITCDCLVEGRHFIPDYTTPMDLGRRAIALNISDIGAMGAWPRYALVSLGLKPDMPVAHVEDLYRGFLAELNPFDAAIVGGNVTKSEYAFFIDITLVGEVETGRAVRRSTAQPGDVILVTGGPGRAAAGLRLLQSSAEPEKLRDHPLVRAYNRPCHRAREGRAVAQTGHVTAMIDTSDGLLGDLGHICDESGVGALLIQERIPVSDDLREAADRFMCDPYELVLSDSDDYELVITCALHDSNGIRAAIAEVSDVSVTEIGTIEDEPKNLRMVMPDGTVESLIPRGWDHFGQQGDRHVR
jgi:thiamine-monophosphate kinase